jgi:post-segregation antitoxin (ccd killing protein)
MNEGMKKNTNVKLGISISNELVEEGDDLARAMGISRSRLYSLALRDFLLRHENTSLLERLNEAYAEPDPEDELLLEGVKGRGRRVLDEDER